MGRAYYKASPFRLAFILFNVIVYILALNAEFAITEVVQRFPFFTTNESNT